MLRIARLIRPPLYRSAKSILIIRLFLQEMDNRSFIYILIGTIISFFIGYGLSKDVNVGWILALIGFLLTLFLQDFVKFKPTKYTGLLGGHEEYLELILLLTTKVIRADRDIGKTELHCIERKLKHAFPEENIDKYMTLLNQYLEKEVSIKSVCHVINSTFDFSTKVQLLHFLTGLSAVDNDITVKEYEMLKKISVSLRISKKYLDSILSMFNYRADEQKRGKSNSSKQRKTTQSALMRSYRILGIEESATDRSVKKAFRKLAVIHHPDKVAHLGEKFQKGAVEKFQKLSDAYEMIKEKRGFS